MPQFIDVAIPRGGEGLIRRVAAEAQMPVIKHFDGNCHVYVDASADLDMAREILINSKCQRFGVCNAAESLLVHSDVAAEFLPRSPPRRLPSTRSRFAATTATCELVDAAKPATEADYAAEFWRRSSRPASSARSTRPSSTSTATARTTPTRS